MRKEMGDLSDYQPLTKLGIVLACAAVWLGVSGWFKMESGRDLVARGVRGDAVVKDIKVSPHDQLSNYRVIFEIQAGQKPRVSREFRNRTHGYSINDTVPIVYLPKYPGIFQLGEEAVVDYVTISLGGVSLVLGIVLPFVEKRREDHREARAFENAMNSGHEFSPTEERQLYRKLDLDAYQGSVERLKTAGFESLANSFPIKKTAIGGVAKLERWLSDGSSLAVLRIIKPGFVAQLKGAEQRSVIDFVSLLGDGTFIVTSTGSGVSRKVASKSNVILVDMLDSMTELMLRQAHDVRLRENVEQRGVEIVQARDAKEAKQVLDGLMIK